MKKRTTRKERNKPSIFLIECEKIIIIHRQVANRTSVVFENRHNKYKRGLKEDKERACGRRLLFDKCRATTDKFKGNKKTVRKKQGGKKKH